MNRVAKFISADTEEELQELFLLIQKINFEQLPVINVYPNKKKFTMWFYASPHTITDIKLKGRGE